LDIFTASVAGFRRHCIANTNKIRLYFEASPFMLICFPLHENVQNIYEFQLINNRQNFENWERDQSLQQQSANTEIKVLF